MRVVWRKRRESGSPNHAWMPIRCATACAGTAACSIGAMNSRGRSSSECRNWRPEAPVGSRGNLVTVPGLMLQRLTLWYGAQPLFEDLSLVVPGGQFVALLGPSGVGKTSLLKIAAGLLMPKSGSVQASDGRPLAG